ncbi:hypothetical protein [Hymenobacter ruricola]|uniref:DUF6311 domain-containing protein n=1 Tax=Hymenobacter ruricola TaxID=2791023 RepID=A0ABS0I9Z6_9BACT|nr:hypothetical protein [Hymenobacter ruricola]MBF9223732.1 hypothetical protein [Hymenobacter ruricola]
MSSSFRKLHWLGMGGVALAALALTAVLFGPVLANPNDFYFNPSGDMLQSYYVTAFYVMHDMGLRFTGMNYPYGEHFNYPNLQPLLATIMGFLHRHGVPAGRYSVAILNLLGLSSLVITPVVLYAVLRRTRLPVLYAGLLALIIGFMSPQVLRLDGHLMLSYAWFVPWLWYCIIRMQEAPGRWRWYIVFTVSILLIGAVMPYFLAVGCAFLLGHVLVLAWQQPRLRRWLLRLALTAALPLLLFRGYLWATDHVTDRPPNPYGLLVFVATPGTVFTPVMGPVYDWWQAQWPGDEPASSEGFSYVGLVSTVTLAASCLLGTAAVLARRRWRRLGRPAAPLHLRTGLWAASLLLIFSFGVPFKWHGFEWLTEHAGQVKQFRSLGRFAWPFYYVATTYTAYCLYRLWRYLRRRRLGALAWVGLPVLLFWGAEAWLQVSTEATRVMANTGANDFLDPSSSPVSQLTWKNRGFSEFQAILPVPYYNMGTDKFDQAGSGNSIFQAYKASAISGLPLLANHIPRSSVGEAMQHIQLFSSPLVPRELLAHFPNNKPLLLLVTPDILSDAEQRLVGLAHLLVQTPEASLYELPLAALAATDLPREQAKADSLLPTLKPRPGGLFTTTAAGVLVQDFAQAADRRGRLGAGAFYEPQDKFSTLYDGPVPAPADTGRYEASVWINGKTDYGFGNMRVVSHYADGGTAESVVDSRKATEVMGDWVRIVVPFRVQPGVQRIEVLYQNHDLLADDLLIRPVNTDVYYYIGTGARRRLVKNTYSLRP